MRISRRLALQVTAAAYLATKAEAANIVQANQNASPVLLTEALSQSFTRPVFIAT